jgi:hypothetical protein
MFQLIAAVTPKGMKGISGEALGVNANEGAIGKGRNSLYQSNGFFPVLQVLEAVDREDPVPCWKG